MSLLTLDPLAEARLWPSVGVFEGLARILRMWFDRLGSMLQPARVICFV